MKFATIFFILFCLNLSAYTNSQIADAIADVSKTQGVGVKILYTIIKIESNFEPFAISFLTNEQNAKYFKKLENKNVKITISNYSLNRAKWVVAIKPINEAYAREIAKMLIKDGFSIDVGLGQINSVNFSKDELDDIFNPEFNLRKCAKVLRKCYNAKSKDMRQTIECYNYGMRNRHSNPYYKRFYEHYKKEFGE